MVVEREIISPRSRKASAVKHNKADGHKEAVLSPEHNPVPLKPEEDVAVNNGSSEEVEASNSNVRVWCRFRPRNKMEQSQQGGECVDFPDERTIKFQAEGEKHEFVFDQVFGQNSSQMEIYEATAKPLVLDALKGFNCTVFTYGQTGSGKTWTMMGSGDGPNSVDENRGVIPRVCEDIFTAVEEAEDHMEFTIKLGYIEIYLEKIRDLFNPNARDLKVREDPSKGVYVEAMSEMYVASSSEMIDLMKKGTANRAIGSTKMNSDSSRSHSVCSITITKKSLKTEVKSIGHIYLVDLAGSETVKKTGASGQTLEEAKMINKSLSALGNVIKGLVDGKGHIPYRDSKLTRVLQDSLGGNSKTSIIITCSSNIFNGQETLSTLRFGSRAKKIKNKPKINQEKSVAELKLLLAEAAEQLKIKDAAMETLKAELEKALQGQSSSSKLTVPNGSQGEVAPFESESEFSPESEELRSPEGPVPDMSSNNVETSYSAPPDAPSDAELLELRARAERQEKELQSLRDAQCQLEAWLAAKTQSLAELNSGYVELQSRLEEVISEGNKKQESQQAAEQRETAELSLRDARAHATVLEEQNRQLIEQFESSESARHKLAEDLAHIQEWVDNLKFSLNFGHFSDDESEPEDNNQREEISEGPLAGQEDNQTRSLEPKELEVSKTSEDRSPVSLAAEAERKASLRTELDSLRKAIIDAKLHTHELEKKAKKSSLAVSTSSQPATLSDTNDASLIAGPADKRFSTDMQQKEKRKVEIERLLQETESRHLTELTTLESQLSEAKNEAASYKRLWTQLLGSSPGLQLETPANSPSNPTTQKPQSKAPAGKPMRKSSTLEGKRRRKSSLSIHVTDVILDAFSPRRKQVEGSTMSSRTEESMTSPGSVRQAAGRVQPPSPDNTQSPLARVFPFLFNTKQKIVKVIRGGGGGGSFTQLQSEDSRKSSR